MPWLTTSTGVAVSAAFLAEITTGHVVATAIEIMDSANKVLSTLTSTNPGGRATATANAAKLSTGVVLDGSVTHTKHAEQRSRCTLKVVDPTGGLLVPQSSADLLTTYGNRVRLYRGVEYQRGLLMGTTELVLLGTFQITDAVAEDAGGGLTIDVSGSDLSHRVARAKTSDYYIVGVTGYAATQNPQFYTDAIQDMVTFAFPGVTFSGTKAQWQQQDPSQTKTDANIPMVFNEGTDLWAEAYKLAKSIGCVLYFNRSGACVLLQDPALALTADPQWSFPNGSVVLSPLRRKLADAEPASRVIMTGEGTNLGGAPPRAVADDTDPQSPTYIGNPVGSSSFGLVAHFETDPRVTTTNQAQLKADAKLHQITGFLDTIEAPTLVNPCIEVDDTVSFGRSTLGLVTTTSYMVDTVTIPLREANPLQMVARPKRSAVV